MCSDWRMKLIVINFSQPSISYHTLSIVLYLSCVQYCHIVAPGFYHLQLLVGALKVNNNCIAYLTVRDFTVARYTIL